MLFVSMSHKCKLLPKLQPYYKYALADVLESDWFTI